MTPPVVALTSPTTDFSTTDTELQVLASASDGRSGIRDAICGLTSSSATGGTINCTVPLGKGQNPVVVQVSDIAGNSASASCYVTRTGTSSALTLAPATLNVLVGEAVPITVKDDFGNAPSEPVTWTVSDPSLAEVLTDADTRLHALGVGTVTVTATAGAISATANVTISAGAALGAGTIRWMVPPAPDDLWAKLIVTHPSSDTGPELFVLEDGIGVRVLRGIDADGRELRREALHLPFMRQDPFGDVYGGAVFFGEDMDTSPRRHLMMRTGGGAASAWTYAADLDYVFGSRPAQTFAGVISVVEWNPDGVSSAPSLFRLPGAVVRLDGSTGTVLSRIELPMMVWRYANTALVEEVPAWRGDPVVGTDGATFLLLVSGETVWPTRSRSSVPTSVNLALQLLRIEPDGTYSVRTLATTTELSAAPPPSWPDSLLVDPTGRLIAKNSISPTFWVLTDAGYTEYSTPAGTGVTMIADDGSALFDGNAAGAVDLNTGSTLWTYSPGESVSVITPAPNGGAIVQTTAGTQQVDSTGATPFPGPAQLINATTFGPDILIGFTTPGLTRVVSAPITEYFFRSNGGSKQGHFSSKCQDPPFQNDQSGNHRGFAPDVTVQYNFYGDNGQGSDIWGWSHPGSIEESYRLAVIDALGVWTAANRVTTRNTSFVLAQDDPSHNQLHISRALLPLNSNGTRTGAKTNPIVDSTTGYITGAVMTFNTDPQVLTKSPAYFKVGLHEGGHLNGLGDNPNGTAGSSVMNTMAGKDDGGKNLPTVVMPCDAHKAKLAATRPWP
jgi:hypothetical protein